jgi:bacteriocin-like protein
MNTDPIIGLREAITIDGTLRAELLTAASFEEAAALACRKGWAVTAADIEQLAREFTLDEGELSEAELASISGGVRSEISMTVVRNLRA